MLSIIINKEAKMKHSKKIIVLILITHFNSFPRAPRQVWRIIHGTFAKDASWYQPGGDFYETLKKCIPPHAVIKSVTWSGKNNDEDRLEGAHALIMDMATYDLPDDEHYLIGHSHGCNVGMLAIKELAKINSPYKIHSFFTLAPPICRIAYQPEMSHLNNLYNFFSFGDRIQPVFQLFCRTYEPHPNIWNIEVTLDNRHPDHGLMHHPSLAQLLPKLHTLSLENEQSLIHFYTDKKAHIEKDYNREKKLKDDKRFTEHMLTALQFIRTYKQQKAVNKYAQEYYEYLTQLTPKSRNFRFWNWRNINSENDAFIKRLTDYVRGRHSISSLWSKKFTDFTNSRESSNKPFDTTGY